MALIKEVIDERRRRDTRDIRAVGRIGSENECVRAARGDCRHEDAVLAPAVRRSTDTRPMAMSKVVLNHRVAAAA